MARAPRIIIDGCYYHLINRGNNCTRVFHEGSDYQNFLRLIGIAQKRAPISLLAVCLMPNHFHLVVRPESGGDLSRWTHWLFTTHARHHHKKYGTSGRIWQGRFKLFPIQEDQHLLTVMRYVERNAQRAKLVPRAEHWRWGSLSWRATDQYPVPLAPAPLQLPRDWIEHVNKPQNPAELEALRASVNRQRPYGHREWVESTADQLHLRQSLAPIGRPKKQPCT